MSLKKSPASASRLSNLCGVPSELDFVQLVEVDLVDRRSRHTVCRGAAPRVAFPHASWGTLLLAVALEYRVRLVDVAFVAKKQKFPAIRDQYDRSMGDQHSCLFIRCGRFRARPDLSGPRATRADLRLPHHP